MKSSRWQTLSKLAEVLKAPPLDPVQHLKRLKAVERDIILPVKAVFLGVLIGFFYFSPWFGETDLPQSIAVAVVETFLLIYTGLNVVAAIVLLVPPRWPLKYTQWVVFSMSFVDGLFVAALTLVTGGFDSLLYWIFLALVVRNAVSNPLAQPQIILNLSVVFSYVLAGVLDVFITRLDLAQMEVGVRHIMETGEPENPTETFLLRLFILLLLAACCYGVQAIFERERRAAEEGRESAARQEQLRAAGRLAAEIAHKIKNPLGIINNAAFSLQRALENNQKPPVQQVQIIREEVDRADRVITELMGYAQLAEGRVERLNVVEELNRALMQVLPPGAYHSIQVHTDFANHLPPLLMQRQHFEEMIHNLLLNAREALGGIGEIHVRTWAREEMLYVSVADDGPGIPPDKLERIFEPYFSTKEKGSGLGLAIVRHNAEMYQGRIQAESELGRGSTFILKLPTRTFMKRRK